MTRKKRLWISLGIFIALCFLVEMIGSAWTKETVSTWYPTLVKPSWTPPDWVFGPVWTVLYVMIAISGWLIYRTKKSHERSVALTLFGVQLALNFMWSFLFFALRSPVLGLIDIIPLLVLIGMTIIKAWPVRHLASLLLIPYLLWVMYATTLNIGIWMLNK